MCNTAETIHNFRTGQGFKCSASRHPKLGIRDQSLVKGVHKGRNVQRLRYTRHVRPGCCPVILLVHFVKALKPFFAVVFNMNDSGYRRVENSML